MERTTDIEAELDKERLRASSLEVSLEELSRSRGRNRFSRRARQRPVQLASSNTFVTAPGQDSHGLARPPSSRTAKLGLKPRLPNEGEAILLSLAAPPLAGNDQFALAPPSVVLEQTLSPSPPESKNLAIQIYDSQGAETSSSVTEVAEAKDVMVESQQVVANDTEVSRNDAGPPNGMSNPTGEAVGQITKSKDSYSEEYAPALPPHLKPEHMYLDAEALRRPSISNDEEYERLRQTIIDSYGIMRVEQVEQTMSELVNSYNKKDEEYVKQTVPDFMLRARVKPVEVESMKNQHDLMRSGVEINDEETQTEPLFTGFYERPKHRSFPVATQTILSSIESNDIATQTIGEQHHSVTNISFKKLPLHQVEKRLSVMTGESMMMKSNNTPIFCRHY